jgi:hypothetical protein
MPHEHREEANKMGYEPPLDDDIATGKADICDDCDYTHETDESCVDDGVDVMYAEYYGD